MVVLDIEYSDQYQEDIDGHSYEKGLWKSRHVLPAGLSSGPIRCFLFKLLDIRCFEFSVFAHVLYLFEMIKESDPYAPDPKRSNHIF